MPRTEGVSSTMLRAESEVVINIAVVGCGRIAKRFYSEVDKVDAASVSALYDINPKAAAALNENLVVESFEEAVERADAVYIATPHNLHYA